MSGLKILAGAATVASIDLVEVAAGQWEKLGIVGLLVLALVVLWRDGSKRQRRLEQIIENNSAVTASSTEVHRQQAALLVEIKDTMKECRK